jgi:hypothetical protein
VYVTSKQYFFCKIVKIVKKFQAKILVTKFKTKFYSAHSATHTLTTLIPSATKRLRRTGNCKATPPNITFKNLENKRKLIKNSRITKILFEFE